MAIASTRDEARYAWEVQAQVIHTGSERETSGRSVLFTLVQHGSLNPLNVRLPITLSFYRLAFVLSRLTG